ncbi:hypothetical protein FOXG_20290 [Fusarium oxysporum f. sp. lycopersici 4287]|uniref:Uncharacterized protein n=2 Tax=Fusarium oxysporum TaxID=5507 RepID=A0A0J9VFB9_FUSO4|nr:hypothetical protein FOXG_20290 [Fusarium oxysporum f. sp. lycopersici 4287]EXK40217.1 hypothetical protein FOMG_07155 [Fusarium oxysporum f. sp. melonis 26406]KAJ9422349.1 hypothetical protein QL093DRAFT_2099373 [Fusarium oxysporum]KNB09994.1 hypothetical protein FOXG_20290 [Fusarium oxysporum f. sp. lycopersici 4287]
MGLFDFINRAFPPSYLEVTATKSWKVTLLFGSDPDLLREAIPQVKLNIGWQAHLELSTKDIIGLMREGLYVSQENVVVQESCMTVRPYQQEHQTYYYDRHFALAGPNWKGNLVVTTLSCHIATNFRVEHLSADKVCRSYALDASKTECWVYSFMINNPEVNANFILDDTPLKGLWPWPRNEHVIQGMEGEREKTKERIEEVEMLDLL